MDIKEGILLGNLYSGSNFRRSCVDTTQSLTSILQKVKPGIFEVSVKLWQQEPPSGSCSYSFAVKATLRDLVGHEILCQDFIGNA